VSYRVKFNPGRLPEGRTAHMRIDQILLGAIVPLYVFLWIGVPIILADWLRKRRQETVKRQVALTEAIDGRLGAVVAPVVKKTLWGPWQVRLAVPFTQPAVVGRILAVVDEMLSASDPMLPGQYRIVLTPRGEPIREKRGAQGGRSADTWSREAMTA
jgi:hypothetical protein